MGLRKAASQIFSTDSIQSAATSVDAAAFCGLFANALPPHIRDYLTNLPNPFRDALMATGVQPENLGPLLIAGAAYFLLRRGIRAESATTEQAGAAWQEMQTVVAEIHSCNDLSLLPDEWKENIFLLLYSAIADQSEKTENLISSNEEIKSQIGALIGKIDGLASYVEAYERFDARLQTIQSAVAAPKLKSNENTPGYRPFETNRLVYRNRPTQFEGRNAEIAQLMEFLLDSRPFLWWLWYGPAGIGKSRLALELVRYARMGGWDAAFYDDKGPWFERWGEWQPERKTLIIFDYAKKDASNIARAIMDQSGKKKMEKVRFLLLERTGDESERWVKDFHQAMDHQDDRYAPQRKLDPLGLEHYLNIAYAIYKERNAALRNEPPISKEDIEQKLSPILKDMMTHTEGERKEDLRPLAALFIAEAVAETGFETAIPWKFDEVAIGWLNNEIKRWSRAGVCDQEIHLLVLATITRGLSNEERLRLATGPLQGIIPGTPSVEQWDAIACSTLSEKQHDFIPLEPDILGEALVLQRLAGDLRIESGHPNPMSRQTSEIVRRAFEIRGYDSAVFTLHCGQDFSSHERLFDLLDIDTELMDLVRHDLVTSFVRSGLLPKADNIIARISRMPIQVSALNNKGVALGALGKSQEAIECYDAVLAMQDAPADQRASALNNKGVALGALGKSQEAIECYDAVLVMQDAPADQRAKALNNKGVALGELGKSQEAIECYDAVLAMQDAPADQRAKAHYNKGVRLGTLGKSQEAIECYDAVLVMQDAPADQRAKAYYNKGVALGELGKSQEEIDCYDAVLAMQDAPADQRAKALNNKGVALGELGKSQEEIDCYDAVLAMQDAPADQRAKALNNKGVALAQQGKIKDALEALRNVAHIEDAPADVVELSIRAIAYIESNLA